jgi:hypothetical protein
MPAGSAGPSWREAVRVRLLEFGWTNALTSLFVRSQSNFDLMTENERLGLLDLVSWEFRRCFSYVHTFHSSVAPDPSA